MLRSSCRVSTSLRLNLTYPVTDTAPYSAHSAVLPRWDVRWGHRARHGQTHYLPGTRASSLTCSRARRSAEKPLLRQLASCGAYGATLARIAKIEVLVLDDFLLAPMIDPERRDLLEVLEDRYDKSSTVITSQLPTKTWHETLVDPTIADAICATDEN
jgi:hypothetical protein